MNKGVKGTEGGVKRGIVNFEMIKWGIFREGAVRELLRGDNSTTHKKIINEFVARLKIKLILILIFMGLILV